MPKPITIDLRSRVINAYKSGEGGYLKLAKRFNVARNSVRRWLGLEKEQGNLLPRPHAGGISPKISDVQLIRLKELVAEKPDRTLPELAIEWNKRNSPAVHASSMSRALKRANISYKKNSEGHRTRSA
jgi:transposase